MSEAPPSRVTGDPRAIFALLLAPAIAACGVLVAPFVALSQDLTSIVWFAGAVAVVVAPLTLASRARPSKRTAAVVSAIALIGLAIAAFAGGSARATSILVDAALVAIAWTAGGAIGWRIEYAGHLLPACAVAAAADLASVVSPEGPTHALAESPRALALLAIGFAVPGTTAVAPALGLGDALFLALILSAARAHRISATRVALAGAMAFSAAGAASALLDMPTPALVSLGAFTIAMVPEFRRVRRKDRAVTQFALALSASVAVAILARRLLLH